MAEEVTPAIETVANAEPMYEASPTTSVEESRLSELGRIFPSTTQTVTTADLYISFDG
jgi:hypothetical protein